jgi:hypothetical protein
MFCYPGGEEDMNIEALACCVVGLRQFCVAVTFTDEHAAAQNGVPVALVRGCTVAREQRELSRLLCPGAEPVGVQLYVEPDTTHAEICSLWMAGFRVRMIRRSEVFAVPGWWHLAAHRHHTAMTRTIRAPRSSRSGAAREPGLADSRATSPVRRTEVNGEADFVVAVPTEAGRRSLS